MAWISCSLSGWHIGQLFLGNLRMIKTYTKGTQKPIHPVKSGFPPVHPLMRMAAQLVNRKVKRFLQQREARGHSQLTVSLEDAVPVTLTCVSFTHRIQGLLQWISPRRITLPPGDDHFSFSGQGMEETLKITPSRTVREFSGKEKLD
ncbi:neuromedin-S isoform X4 [Mustela erminea]|uniref:neuromedin-S isoform X4 n=2 Tax=Mustela erminea TaxID=36723 RepID=UPI0013867894|nr:neuromedin-S isoform X4 [Mustela erminea]XP_032207703.1 neuromedin-S isoform X4 [Mustela erminea]XP_032207705.1 neuromedin-S isoform X4 [Mustela erminea]XP_032207706.1 neuromedin-S isoform X4 [Mustela erminea]